MPRVSLVSALNLRGVIGIANRLPWKLPRDLSRFRQVTLGKPVLMGRLTFESIGRPLPARTNVVLSRDDGFHAEGCLVAPSLDQALALGPVAAAEEVMVIGGGNVYAQCLGRADNLYLTLVHNEVEGDAWFPCHEKIVPVLLEPWTQLSESLPFRETSRWDCPADAQNPWRCTFVTWERTGRPLSLSSQGTAGT